MKLLNDKSNSQTKLGQFSARLSDKGNNGRHESFRLNDDFFRNLIDSLDDYAVITTDLNGVISSWNSGATKLFGYGEKDVIGKKIDILYNSVDIKKNIPYKEIQTALKIGRAYDERWHIGKHGKTIWASGLSFSLKDDDGKVRGFTKVMRDATAAKQLDQQKDDFIGIAAHELKTPVTSIKTYTQVLENRFKKAGDQKSAELLHKMDTQLDRLDNLMGDLLDVTRIESNRFHLNNEVINFDKFISGLVNDFQHTISRHKLIVKGRAGAKITIDQERLKQVINNLISNAIKYSPDSKQIILHVSSHDGKLKLTVEDQGIGLSSSAKEKVFDRFYRVSGPNQKSYPGLGIGLYVSAEIVKRLGGKIWVESELGQGSTFCIFLPLIPPDINAEKILIK